MTRNLFGLALHTMFCISVVCIRASGGDLRQLMWIILTYKAIDLKPESMRKFLSLSLHAYCYFMNFQFVNGLA